MRNHIRGIHKSAAKLEDEKPKQIQLPITHFSASKKKLGSSYEEITSSLALFCALDLRPISIVEGRGFKNFMAKVNPDYKVPVKKTVTLYLTKLYEDLKEQVIKSTEGTTVAFTTDMWTSCAKMGYITVTAHYITDDWNLNNKVIATRAVPEKHTGTNIANVVTEIKNEFKITKLRALVTDNAANMVLAADVAQTERWPCFSHTLQLSINDALTKISAITKAVAFGRKLVTHFNHSPLSVKALKDQQLKMGIKTPLNVIQDVSTRWNSQFLMIERLLKVRVSIYGVLLDESVTKSSERASLAVPEASWKVMEDICPILAPLAEATELLTSEKTPTLSQVYVLLFHLMKRLSPEPDDSAVAKDLKKRISANLSSRFNLDEDDCPNDTSLCSIAMVATLLDPRYKSVKFLPEAKKKVLTDYVCDLISDSENHQSGDAPAASAGNTVKSESPDSQSLMTEWLSGDIIDLTVGSSTNTSAELQRYLEEPVRERDPLVWWSQNDNK